MSATVNWAQSGMVKTTAAAAIRNTCKQRFIEASENKFTTRQISSVRPSLPRARSSGRRVQHEVLHTIPVDLADHEVVVDPAVNLVDRGEVFQALACLAKLADHRAVQLHLVHFAADGGNAGIVVDGVRDRAIEVLVRSRCNTNGPGRADMVVDVPEHQ